MEMSEGGSDIPRERERKKRERRERMRDCGERKGEGKG
jgi:hypothetical protein